MKTLTERHIEIFHELRAGLIQRLDDIAGLIEAGKPLSHGRHSEDVGSMTYNLMNSIRHLAPSPPVEPGDKDNKLQRIAQDIIEQYIADNELDPILLGGEIEHFDVKLSEANVVWSRGIGEFDLPDALLYNHRDEILELIEAAIKEEPFCEFVDLEEDEYELQSESIEIV